MSFTYEMKDRKETLEKYEWDDAWIEQTSETDAYRVLYIGDSISCVTRKICTERSKNEILFDGFGTSKAVDNPYFIDSIKLFSAQVPNVNVVLFNNGLHGWHLSDEEEYPKYYENVVKELINHFKDTPILLALTTDVADPERSKRVVVRNSKVLEIAKKYSLKVVDLFEVATNNKHLHSDGVHFQPAGYELIADTILNAVK